MVAHAAMVATIIAVVGAKPPLPDPIAHCSALVDAAQWLGASASVTVNIPPEKLRRFPLGKFCAEDLAPGETAAFVAAISDRLDVVRERLGPFFQCVAPVYDVVLTAVEGSLDVGGFSDAKDFVSATMQPDIPCRHPPMRADQVRELDTKTPPDHPNERLGLARGMTAEALAMPIVKRAVENEFPGIPFAWRDSSYAVHPQDAAWDRVGTHRRAELVFALTLSIRVVEPTPTDGGPQPGDGGTDGGSGDDDSPRHDGGGGGGGGGDGTRDAGSYTPDGGDDDTGGSCIFPHIELPDCDLDARHLGYAVGAFWPTAGPVASGFVFPAAYGEVEVHVDVQCIINVSFEVVPAAGAGPTGGLAGIGLRTRSDHAFGSDHWGLGFDVQPLFLAHGNGAGTAIALGPSLEYLQPMWGMSNRLAFVAPLPIPYLFPIEPANLGVAYVVTFSFDRSTPPTPDAGSATERPK